MDRSSKKLLVASVVAGLSLAGCVVTPPRVAIEPPHIGWVTPLVVTAPPVAVVETYPPPPAPGYVWCGGYWNWVGGRHVWVGGHWSAPPYGGAVWVPHAWVRHEGGWRLREGHWDRHHDR